MNYIDYKGWVITENYNNMKPFSIYYSGEDFEFSTLKEIENFIDTIVDNQ